MVTLSKLFPVAWTAPLLQASLMVLALSDMRLRGEDLLLPACASIGVLGVLASISMYLTHQAQCDTTRSRKNFNDLLAAHEKLASEHEAMCESMASMVKHSQVLLDIYARANLLVEPENPGD